MRDRKVIHKELNENAAKIDALVETQYELEKENALLCDEDQWFEEKPESITIKKDGKKVKETAIIGRVHWNEEFPDEDSDRIITIARSRVVKVNGKWQL